MYVSTINLRFWTTATSIEYRHRINQITSRYYYYPSFLLAAAKKIIRVIASVTPRSRYAFRIDRRPFWLLMLFIIPALLDYYPSPPSIVSHQSLREEPLRI